MTVTFGEAERQILKLFPSGRSFFYDGVEYIVRFSGKPTCRKGEPKTDIYVLTESVIGIREFKISFKKNNADFLENKINAERARQLFGTEWGLVISNATSAMQKDFATRPLIYRHSFRRTKAGAITLGWKFELLNVGRGQLSGDMLLSRSQVIDVYSGTNLQEDKRDAAVNGKIIPNSGIANYILFEGKDKSPATAQEAINMLISVEEYVEKHPKIYFACKALNYRTRENKYDGNRPLAVYVDWDVQNGKMVSRLVYDTPLQQGGDYAFVKLNRAMKTLGITSAFDIGAHNVNNMGIVWNG